MRKLVGVAHRQAVAETALTLCGPDGAATDGAAADAVHEFLLTRCLSIAGGTTQILLSCWPNASGCSACPGKRCAEWTSPSARPSRRSPASPPTCWTSGQPAAGPGEPYDSALWKELGQAGLLSLALPAWLGGDGLGVLDTAVLLTEVGRRAAPVPALATLMLGVLPVVRWADRDLQQALLAGVAAGDTVLTAAVREPSDPMPPAPATTAWLSRRVRHRLRESRSACRTPPRRAGSWCRPASPRAAPASCIVDPSR